MCVWGGGEGGGIHIVQSRVDTYTDVPAYQFSSVQDGVYALGKAHMRSTPSLGSFPNVALETVSVLV